MIVLFLGLRWGCATLTHTSASVPLIRLFSSFLLEMPREKTAADRVCKVDLTNDNAGWRTRRTATAQNEELMKAQASKESHWVGFFVAVVQ